MKRIFVLFPLALAFALTACDECVMEDTPPPGSGVDMSQIITGKRPVCTPVTYCVTMGPGFTAEQKALVSDALEDWHVSTAGIVQTAEDPETAGCIPVQIAAEERKWFVQQGLHVKTKGFTDDGVIHLSINELCGSKTFSFTIRHEFGHILGIPHIDDESAIMYPRYDEETSSNTLQTIDVQTYFDLQGCEPEAPIEK